ncbi:hypothetical protein EV649_7710 [Kribbella sp. VKM Ac-2569]|uniref:DUF5691 domain-containing protein n=1 Tax=Kribbella sp. VKM Ac-2569 TaxID=2512220 RepID=UPI00102CA982|nr:DUF5691 domain-containing protein [Kribbella sp. VKM Ac-2569]RZT07782.1 hypothetical protein EV649_7710 [Kribbella sp. VKM Ac-2569]
MKGWDGLVSSALLGTDRRPPHFDELPEHIQERLGDGNLLDAAALATVYKRAGRKPLHDLEPLPAAPGEDRPLPRANAVRRLAAMLGGFQTSALGEWLRTADAHGWGVPPEHLPALADYARNRAEYRPLVIAASGRRARWLADLNPEWRFLHAGVAESNDPELWTHGNAIQRRTWLRATRTQDPAAAREALKEVWPTESAATRADFLGLLADNLTRPDEEFLESALDDRSREVRRVAARLLARLPGSQYGVRMTERLHAHLLPSQGVLAVDLPRSLTQSMERDGLDSQNPEGVGKRAWWFHQIVANTPLQAMDLTWLQTPVEGCAVEVLQSAWTEAAIRESSVEWSRAILQAGSNTGSRGPAELLRLLPAEEWASAVDVLRKNVDVAELVGGLPVPWPAPLASMILDQLAKVGTARAWARLASIAARAAPPDVLDHPITREPTGEEDTWRRRLVETLTFRREMYEELT